MKWGLKGGISMDADSGPPRYVFWYYGGICHEDFTFIQIGSSYTVLYKKMWKIEVWFVIFNNFVEICKYVLFTWYCVWDIMSLLFSKNTLKYVDNYILRKPKTQFWKRFVVGKSRERKKKSWQRKPFKYFLSDCRRQQSVLWLAVPYAAHKQIQLKK